MISPQDLTRIEITLLDKMLAHLAMRWPKAATYIPSGTTRVLCAGQLREDEQSNLDVYVLAYQDAIQDILRMLDKDDGQPAAPMALREAENSVFQGGSLPPRRGSGPGAEARQRGSVAGRAPRKPAPDRGVRRYSEARRRLEALFEGGRDDG